MDIKAVALNHIVVDRTGFFCPKGIQFDCVSNRLGVIGDRSHRRPSAGAWIENADSISVERQESPNSLCLVLWKRVVPEFLPRNAAHKENLLSMSRQKKQCYFKASKCRSLQPFCTKTESRPCGSPG